MRVDNSLFFLLIQSDGNVSDNEMARGKQMPEAEGTDEAKFSSLLQKLILQDRGSQLKECVNAIKKFSIKDQIRCIAWLCFVANADGFMDKKEWILIYKMYHTELGLRLDDIMMVQKELNALVHVKELNSLGVKMS